MIQFEYHNREGLSMKKGIAIAFVVAMALTVSMPAYAGEWKQDSSGWWYQNDDGSYLVNQWKEIEGKQYYFDESGYKLVNTITPDGRLVDGNGVLIIYNNGSYQSILDYYTVKIKAATPSLIAEYKAEAKNNTSGLMGLAEISNNKVSVLAEISNEGVGEMAELLFRMGSGKYSEYEEWAGKLYDVYSDEADKIYDVYMNSAL